MPYVEWIEEPPGMMARAAHAVATPGGVWVFDPFDPDDAAECATREAEVRALGEPAGVVQLLDRHERSCAAWAERLGVEHHVLPRDGLPFELIGILSLPLWKEVAAWFPDSRTLVVADALAAGPGYRRKQEVLGVHPFLRALPPIKLGKLDVEHLLLGHGPGLHGDQARDAIDEALRTARSGIPGFALDSVLRVFKR